MDIDCFEEQENLEIQMKIRPNRTLLGRSFMC